MKSNEKVIGVDLLSPLDVENCLKELFKDAESVEDKLVLETRIGTVSYFPSHERVTYGFRSNSYKELLYEATSVAQLHEVKLIDFLKVFIGVNE